MGQCIRGVKPKNKESIESTSIDIQIKNLNSSITVNYDRGDCLEILTKEQKSSCRFEQVLKEGLESDMELLEKCQTIRRPTIFAFKEAKPLYSTQNGLLELVSERNSKKEIKSSPRSKCPKEKSSLKQTDQLLSKMNTILSEYKKKRLGQREEKALVKK